MLAVHVDGLVDEVVTRITPRGLRCRGLVGGDEAERDAGRDLLVGIARDANFGPERAAGVLADRSSERLLERHAASEPDDAGPEVVSAPARVVPAVHVDAVAVSPGEVATHVQAGKLRTLAVMADKRVKGFENVPTAKEQGVNLSLATWRGLAAPKGTPPEIVAMLADVARKSIDEPVVKDTTDRLGMGLGYADGPAFAAMMKRDNETFKALVQQLGLKGA